MKRSRKYAIFAGTIAVSTAFLFNLQPVQAAIGQWSYGESTIYYIAGNLGLGTSTPTQKIDVVGNVKATSFMLNDTNNISYSTALDTGNLKLVANRHITAVLGAETNSRFRVTNNTGTEKFFVDMSGNVNTLGNITNAGTLNSTGKITIGTSALNTNQLLLVNGDAVFTRNDGTSKLTIQTPSTDVRLVTNNKNLLIPEGNVGIGTYTPDINYKLSVNGKIRAKEIVVETGWADFVFEDNYDLMTIEEVSKYIEDNGHLPSVPSAKEIESNGVSLGDSQKVLLQKVEELTLYVIELNEENKELSARVSELEE